MKEIKLKRLEKSYEEGLVSKEEYEKQKKELEELQEEKVEVKEEVKEVKLKSDRMLIIMAIGLILIFAVLIGMRYLNQEVPETIDELHEYNLKGKLKPEQGYLYNEIYSFVKFEDLWFTQLVSPQGTRLYEIQFRYGPREVEEMDIIGTLDTELLNKAREYYVTFNPTGNDFSSVALAVGDFNAHMTKVFIKQPIAACDKSGTSACRDRPVITCDNTDELVLYVKEANISRVSYDDNCILIEGSGFDLIKGVNRVLYDFYEIIN